MDYVSRNPLSIGSLAVRLAEDQVMLDSIRALEFYCGIGKVGGPSAFILPTFGIGGLHCALSRSSVGNNATIVRAFDWDQLACTVYTANHGPGIAHRVRAQMSRTLCSGFATVCPLRSTLVRWMRTRSNISTRTYGSCLPHANRIRCSTQRRRGPRIPAHSLSCT
jgi:hypothetical protein